MRNPNRVLLIGTLSTSIESSPSSEGILTVSGGLSKGLGLGLSSFRRATSIFGICTQYLIGARQSMDARGFRSMSTSVCQSIILLALQDAVDSVGIIDRCSGDPVDRCSGDPVDRFGLGTVDRCSWSGVDRHKCDLPKLIRLSTSKSPSCSFSSFTWCFITSSPTSIVKASCLLRASHV
ncbi:hypothetical protein F2Q69_00012605 [Brassica cretica]|uniref:Uncharacterized protein n=1 Tax=Brassica cretica TaxID=69181 RepID=A0A8S9QTZ7_BRACR|nr:hypothetical protein F2Q69_00012605 [Brassica cretica]